MNVIIERKSMTVTVTKFTDSHYANTKQFMS